MEKPLTQILFDFNSTAEKDVSAAETTVLEMPKPEEPTPVIMPALVPKKTGSIRGRRSLKDIDVNADLIQVPEDEILFQKQYYSIGEVAIMFRENQSLIRYWENEFDILKPKKNAKGDRFFRPEDVKNLKLIHHLLRQRKYTIEGAKEFLKSNKTASEKFEMIRSLQKLKSFLNELKASL